MDERRILTTKGDAWIVATDGENTTLHALFPSPPGSPLKGTLKGTEHLLQVKVHGCRATETAEGKGFEITGRFVNLSRDARLLLTARDTQST